jgi:PAS domain S-box-containing protein
MVVLNQQEHASTLEWFSALVQRSSDLIIVLDEQGDVTYSNPATEAAFGVPTEAVLGTSGLHYVHRDDRDRLVLRLAQLVQSPGASMTDTIRFVSATGEIRVLEAIATNYLHEALVAGIVINARDITEHNRYMRALETSFGSLTVALANAVELRDPYTAGHQREVAKIAIAIARELALPEDDIKGIGVASTLHDCGKIAIPAEILAKPGRLSTAELEIIKMHSQAGADIVADVAFPWPVAEMIRQHHERLDGSGYPNGLVGKAILMGIELRVLQSIDEPLRLVASELASGLTLREPHWAACFTEVGVACVFKEGQQLPHPARRGRWA